MPGLHAVDFPAWFREDSIMIKDDINEMVARAVRTYRQTVLLNSHEKRECLELLADAFEAREEQILAANRADTEAAAARGRPERLIDRIRITDAQLDKILRQLRSEKAGGRAALPLRQVRLGT